jgi:hypothetical protein
MEISGPTQVTHNLHVGFDSLTGQIEGLPPAWQGVSLFFGVGGTP